jgi:hypothetical protein
VDFVILVDVQNALVLIKSVVIVSLIMLVQKVVTAVIIQGLVLPVVIL